MADETCLLSYPGRKDKIHLFNRVIAAMAGYLSLQISQNYYGDIFSELDFQKDKS